MLQQCGCHHVDKKEDKYYAVSELIFFSPSDSVKENDFYIA
jgi:hypothetical protein